MAKMFQCVCDICESVVLAVEVIRSSRINSNMEVPSVLNSQIGTDNLAHSLGFATLCSKKHMIQSALIEHAVNVEQNLSLLYSCYVLQIVKV